MEKVYEPNKYEKDIYEKWMSSGYFNPDNLDLPEDALSYTIVLPPPNVTDKLHMGHASTVAIEDLLIRYHRLKGYRTLWIPGTDHAAIATQNVVEKRIYKESGKTRHDLGRDKFLQEVNSFALDTQTTILNQIKSLGASLDWSRLAFTLDEPRQKAVRKMFSDMYSQGVIYRGERVVNWCPRCQSTLADDEVEYKGQKAKLYTFKYSVDFPFAISTTRPETKLGDTAVAVNPKDERYKKYIGQTFELEFVGVKLKLKVIADNHVDKDFGTGALGVTPAHSLADWQMAQSQNLEMIKVISEEGKIRDGFFKYSGKNVKEAREEIVIELEKQGLMEKVEEIDNNLSICYRCDSPIEPLPSKQWFVSVDKKLPSLGNKSLKEKALEVVANKDIKIVPERFEKRYKDWMENLHDWCISRQIWFGHRIPVWYKEEEVYVGETAPKEEGWIQDEDTLDTWFSSGMWTFSTLGWPDNFENRKTGQLEKYHPTQVLETGYEIITLWVSRMIMMSLFSLQEIPFETVYLHGMVLDKNGKKMSKSKGNGIDPIEVIAKFGTDSARLSLLIGTTPGNDLRLDEEKIASYRNFVNKLWNISRYIIDVVGSDDLANIDFKKFSNSDKWIFYVFDKLIIEVSEDLDNYRFSAAGEKLRDFTWNDLADWYIEISKFEKAGQKREVLNYILENLLKLWHPFMPFVTEAIWQESGRTGFLMVNAWPIAKLISPENIDDFKESVKTVERLRNVIVKIREARSENKVDPAKKVEAVIYAHDKLKELEKEAELVKSLRTGISSLHVQKSGPALKGEIKAVFEDIEVYLIGAIDREKEKERIDKEINNLEKLISNTDRKLSNKEFVSKAPVNVVEAEKNKLETWKTELSKLKEQI
ncbi:MAG: valine--tRNA ligase [Candidatus Pacebacteria bacterium]|nr:valine--tRNA ligase [Candidatus Paceibacterota bacterium]